MISLLIGSPNPVPFGLSVSVSPTCLNLSNTLNWSSSDIPIPVSEILMIKSSFSSEAEQTTSPLSVNFDALESKLINTCISLSRSPFIVGRSLAIFFFSLRFFESNTAAVAASAWSITALISTFSMCHSILPASIFARSSTSFIRVVNRSPSETTTLRF